MDMKKIDLEKIRPAIYAPYNYFSIGNKLGEMGEWKKHFDTANVCDGKGYKPVRIRI